MKKRREFFGKIGLVLSGGAGKGGFQVGALSVILKNNINFSYIAGVSVGAIAASKCLEVMPDAEELEKATLTKFQNPPFIINREMFRHPLKAKAILDNAPLKRLISELNLNKIISSPVEFHIITANFLNGEEKVFSNHECARDMLYKAIIASTAIPGIFKPEIISGEIFIDGGMVNPLPVKNAIIAGCDTIIILDANPKIEAISPDYYHQMGWFEILSKGYGLPLRKLAEKEIIRTDRINKNLVTLKLLQNKISREAGQAAKPKIETIFDKTNFYFETRKRVRLVIIRPNNPLLASNLRWGPNDMKKMIAEGKKIAEAILKKHGLI